jgi:hypothetical protein
MPLPMSPAPNSRTSRCVCCVLFVLPPFVGIAEDMTGETPLPPPAFKVLRFDEDYSCLTNPANRTDWLFDPIKYIPLRKDASDWYLTLGGEVRERFEGVYDPNFGIGGAGANSYWLQRLTFLADAHLGERVRVFAEGISGVVSGESQPAPPVQDDEIDLQFAFADVVPYLTTDERFTLRAGRFGMSLGSGRLVATRAAPNIPFRFDGFEALYSRPGWDGTGFLVRPVKDTGGIDNANPDTTFWGIYLTHWFGSERKGGIDIYYLGIANEEARFASGSGDEHRHSFGARLFGEKNQWDWNGEGVVQAGTFGGETIFAWTASLDGGYTFTAPLEPRLGLKVDVASGDENPNKGPQGTFNPLFFKSGYFNDASLVRPANIIDVHPNVSANLTRSVSINGGADVFWRYSTRDAIYAPPGFIEVPALQTGTAYFATALDVNLEWRIQRHISFGASYVHFFTGDYVHKAGGHDVDYVSSTLSFLF